MHDLLMLRSHCPQRIKEISCPHNLRVHDDFVDQMISMGYKLPLLCSENSINLSLNLLGREFLPLIVLQSVWHLLSSSAQLRVGVELFEQNLQLVLDAQDT